MIAVTVLTSMNQAALRETGVVIDLMDQVLRLAELTREAGLDGVVASPRETAAIRSRCGAGFAIVTPGIRGGAAAGDAKDDQERTMSPDRGGGGRRELPRRRPADHCCRRPGCRGAADWGGGINSQGPTSNSQVTRLGVGRCVVGSCVVGS